MPVDIASAITQHRVTGISAVPAIWTSVLNMLDPQPVAAALRQVRYITVSGGDLPPGHLTRLADLLPGTQIFKTYGQSETFRSGILLPSEFRQKMLSVGRPVRGTQVFIVNARRKQALPNEAGEILHLGEGTMLGYLGDPKGTRRKLRANPLQRGRGPCRQLVVFTGDIGRIDEDGYLYVLGRKDKMIKSSGYRVYPKEVCDQILRHPCAEDAAVFGIPDPTLGQVIVAEVQTKSDCSLTERDLKTFLADKLPSYMLPGRIALVSAFPRTPSGKIRLAEVEAKYREQE
jgi:acyl-CoA synthetase (AMP-forming)/AMP-acid ligase II